jgi:hypothetical protein
MLPYIISDYENQGEKELTKVDYNTSVVLRIKDNHNTLTSTLRTPLALKQPVQLRKVHYQVQHVTASDDGAVRVL